MKILVISQKYYPEPFRITDICETLVKRKHDVTVLCGLPNYPEGKVLEEYRKKEHKKELINGVNIIRVYEHGRGTSAINLFLNFYSYSLFAQRKVKYLDKDFDVIFVNQLTPVMMAWPALKYAKKYKKKILLYCYDLWPASLVAGGIKHESFIYKYYKKVSKKIYDTADRILVTSKSFESYFEMEHNISKEKIYYLPQYSESIYTNIENRINKYEFNYVFAGNIGKMQSVETIIKAANQIKEDKSIKIHIVGDGSDLERCKELVSNYKLENIKFYGRKPIEEMPMFFSIANAMIVTLSKDDLISKTLPGKVQSYMCAGKPIIAAIDGETQIILKEANCGSFCNAEDYISLAKLFIEFKNVDYDKLSENAKTFYERHFSKEKFFATLEENLKEII